MIFETFQNLNCYSCLGKRDSIQLTRLEIAISHKKCIPLSHSLQEKFLSAILPNISVDLKYSIIIIIIWRNSQYLNNLIEKICKFQIFFKFLIYLKIINHLKITKYFYFKFGEKVQNLTI